MTSLSENGVASGDVTQERAVLWARPVAAGRVQFEIATDPAFSEIVAILRTDFLGDVPVKVTVDGLSPETTYYYRAIGPDGDTQVGRFSTAAASGYQGLTFGVSGDLHGSLSPYAALSNADDAGLDFFAALGDTIYADSSTPAFPTSPAQTIEEFHIKYDETLSERGGQNFLAQLRTSTPFFATIDDHEVRNDFAGGAPATSDPRFVANGADFINETSLYANGLQAFHDYQPIDERFWSGTGDDRFDGAPDLYRAQTYGSDAAVFVLDARSFRDEDLAPANASDPADVTRFLEESFNPNRTMLGKPQLDRLKSDLVTAEQNGMLWKFVAVPEPIQNLGVLTAQDRFEGYAAERAELLEFIAEQDITNVVFIAADIHGTIVNNLTYQTAPGGPQVAVDAWEITTGAAAFSPGLGPASVSGARNAGLLSSDQLRIYNSLPVTNDADGTVDDKDDFIKDMFNGQLSRLGYDPIGLNSNLVQADGLINSKLLSGDYVAAHSFGWTEFDIDPVTHALQVTTYGVRSYSKAEALESPELIATREPVIVSQFVVQPDQRPRGGGWR